VRSQGLQYLCKRSQLKTYKLYVRKTFVASSPPAPFVRYRFVTYLSRKTNLKRFVLRKQQHFQQLSESLAKKHFSDKSAKIPGKAIE